MLPPWLTTSAAPTGISERKAVVVGAWLFLTASSFAVACPTQVPSNSLEASVVVAGDTSRPVYMLRNEGPDPGERLRSSSTNKS